MWTYLPQRSLFSRCRRGGGGCWGLKMTRVFLEISAPCLITLLLLPLVDVLGAVSQYQREVNGKGSTGKTGATLFYQITNRPFTNC